MVVWLRAYFFLFCYRVMRIALFEHFVYKGCCMHVPPGLYASDNGKYHNVIGVSHNTEDESRLVIFQAIANGASLYFVHIPLVEFLNNPLDGSTPTIPAPRFTLVKRFRKALVLGHSPNAGLYRHFKGNTYNVIGVASTCFGAHCMMVYQPLGGPHPLKLSHRPLAMFLEEVDRPEIPYQGPRFLCIQTYVAPRIETRRSRLAATAP